MGTSKRGNSGMHQERNRLGLYIPIVCLVYLWGSLFWCSHMGVSINWASYSGLLLQRNLVFGSISRTPDFGNSIYSICHILYTTLGPLISGNPPYSSRWCQLLPTCRSGLQQRVPGLRQKGEGEGGGAGKEAEGLGKLQRAQMRSP